MKLRRGRFELLGQEKQRQKVFQYARTTGRSIAQRGGGEMSRRRGVGEHFRVRRAVLFLVASCYFAAFWSLYADFPGLLGSRGVLPSDALLGRAADATLSRTGGKDTLVDRAWMLPTLLWFHDALGLSVDACADAICLLGLTLSACAAMLAVSAFAGGIAVVWGSLFVLYLSMFVVGQTFLSFQWDILLLEVGFLCTFMCPGIRARSRAPTHPVVVWALRFLAFKLMLMSGAVKIQSGCPTWHELTALDHHWATQPLPTPLAWFARRATSSAVRKLGVAVTLALEGPGTLMLIAPFRECRHAGATAQILMQLAIAATGNYTFFNVITVALMVACFDDAGLPVLLARGGDSGRGQAFAKRNTRATTAVTDTTPISTPVTPIATPIDDGSDDDSDDDDSDSSDSTSSPVLGVVSTPAVSLDDLPADPSERRRVIAAMTTTPRPGRTPVSRSLQTSRGGMQTPRQRKYKRERGSLTLVELLVDFMSCRLSRRVARVFVAVAGGFFAIAVMTNCAVMFRVDVDESDSHFPRVPSLTLGITIEQTNLWLAVVVPAAVFYVWAVALPLSTLRHVATETFRSRSKLVAVFRIVKSVVFLAAGVLMIGISARPMTSLLTETSGFAAALPPATFADASILQIAAKAHVSNGYGLFRRMTGVGANGTNARPEVIVEASYDDDGSTWTPLVFKYKPGPTNVAPRFVAPHQPRLDWQMWFAALGSYDANPWFVHFVVRLLKGTPEVWDLLDASEHAKFNAPPKWIRATRREYDFSRGRWREKNGNGAGDAWWTVAETEEQYLPALSLDNESVQTFLQAHRFLDVGAGDAMGDAKRAHADGPFREYASTAVVCVAFIFGVALAGAAILADAVAVTAVHSFILEHEDAKRLVRRRRYQGRREKRKIE